MNFRDGGSSNGRISSVCNQLIAIELNALL